MRAARALSSDLGADIKLVKKIPAKGGLGGGSSNAAMTLLALNALWRLGLGGRDLRQIGSGLGADVPFFLLGGTVLATGTGTELSQQADGQMLLVDHRYSERFSFDRNCLRSTQCSFLDNQQLGLYSFKFLHGAIFR